MCRSQGRVRSAAAAFTTIVLHLAGLMQTNGTTSWDSISPLLQSTFAASLPTIPTLDDVAASPVAGITFMHPFATFTVSMHDGPTAIDVDGIRVDTATVACPREESGAYPGTGRPVLEAGPTFPCAAEDYQGTWEQAGTGICHGLDNPQLCVDTLPRYPNACTEPCKANLWPPSVQLTSMTPHASGYAPASAQPAWAQSIFPPVPSTVWTVTLRYTMDQRYRPELFGGNPCAEASPSHNCTLCNGGPWDYAAAPGVWILWSAAGRTDYVITGPHAHLVQAWDAGEFAQTIDAPAALNLQPGEFPIVAFLTTSQYMAPTNLGTLAHIAAGDNWCLVRDDSAAAGLQGTNTAFFLRSTTLFYRQAMQLPQEPPAVHPRLYGADTIWLTDRVRPFTDLPCYEDAAQQAGYLGQPGIWDAKNYFESAMFSVEYHTCDNAVTAPGYSAPSTPALHDDIFANVGAIAYADSATRPPRYDEGLRALHLLRRCWACAAENGGDYATCEHSAAQVDLFARAVADADMTSFLTVTAGPSVNYGQSISWECGVTTEFAECTYDLATSYQVHFWSMWYDVMASQSGIVNPANLTLVSDGLLFRIELFRSQFLSGHWTLWNGNNWTPNLARTALRWAIVFWHERPVIAHDVVQIVNDVLWLHYPNFYRPDGSPVEGVSYSYLSIADTADIAGMHLAAFGFSPEAIDVEAIEATVTYHLASLDTSTTMVR